MQWVISGALIAAAFCGRAALLVAAFLTHLCSWRGVGVVGVPEAPALDGALGAKGEVDARVLGVTRPATSLTQHYREQVSYATCFGNYCTYEREAIT